MAPRANLLLLLFVFLLHNVLGGDQGTEQVEKILQENQKLQRIPAECDTWLQNPHLNRTHFFSAEGSYFYFNMTKVDWYKTRDWCAENGMQMAMLKTRAVIKAVKNELIRLTSRGGSLYWMGASDVGQTPGQFRWVDGTPVDDDTWHKGEIYKLHGNWNVSTYAFLFTGYEGLNDGKSSNAMNILCQVPSALAACL